jgi:regulator of sigma E protease
VFVHEGGHFIVARAVGMRPRKFYLGFGPPIVKWVRSGVEYGIGSIPLGGYVKIPGMNRPSPGDLRKALPPAEQERLAGPLARLDEALQRRDEPGARAALAELEPELGRNRAWQELEMGLAPDAYWRQRTWKRVAAIAAGPATNIVFAIVIFAALLMLGTTKATRTVDRVLAGHPAAAAGLHAGDRLVSVGGKAVHNADDVPAAVDATGGHPFRIVVERDGHRVVLGPLRAKLDQGAYRVGFQLRAISGPGESPPQAVWGSLKIVGSVTSETARSIERLATGKDSRNISSSVGIVRASQQALKQSIQDYLSVLGLISLALALLNLLPVLPLDGGHILMALLEKVRGRTFSQVVYMRYAAVGFALFAVLMYIGLRNDLFGGG